MTTTPAVPLKHQKERENLLSQVANSEKQLWTVIHYKGLLHADVQELYHNVCNNYEKIILSDYEQPELQDVEYSLWKLHYKHIDEFRKRIKKTSGNSENINMQRSDDVHMTRLKLFLSEATEFYQTLIVKMRRYHGLPEDSLNYKRGGTSSFIEPKKLQKCQFLCHRFLVCLGDLARYKEQYEKSEARFRDWSAAATHYFEATMIRPDSGNPQNQLAVLATYVGDEFLALYHCVRSLAVKDPFADARDNLILLFERNRSSQLNSISRDVRFDFLKPFECGHFHSKSQEGDDLLNGTFECEDVNSLESNLWPLIIRMLSSFFIKSSLEEFPSTFASTMRYLDTVMALDDSKLKATLESYQLINSVRTGPFRALQVVSIFIFMLQHLFHSPETKEPKDANTTQHLMLTQFALASTFIFMGRLVHRCLNGSKFNYCPILPAVLVFAEWLIFTLDEAETYGVDVKSRSAMSYFFDVFVNLLERLNVDRGKSGFSQGIPLWEDYELRGFTPLALVHEVLDFSTHREHMDGFESGAKHRAYRIMDAAMKICSRPSSSQKWIFYDKSARKFYTANMNDLPHKKQSEKVMSVSDINVEASTQIETPRKSYTNGKSVSVEDEEVILFKPLTRYNSAPIRTSVTGNGETYPKDTGDQNLPSDDCLRRATSLLIAQNPGKSDPSAFHTDITNFRRNKSLKQQEPLAKEVSSHQFPELTISAGPPSLSGWVLNRGGSSSDIEKESSGFNKHGLSPIRETTPVSLESLTLADNEDPITSFKNEPVTTSRYPSSYLPPLPSAPLLPEDNDWFNDIHERDTFPAASHGSAFSNRTAMNMPLDYDHSVSGYMSIRPPTHHMTSSEWLRLYRENHNLVRSNNPECPVPFYPSGNLHNYGASGYDHLDRWKKYPFDSKSMHHTESSQLGPCFPRVWRR